MQDLLEQANEVQESLGRSYALPDDVDESELDAGKSKDSHDLNHPGEVFVLKHLDEGIRRR